MNDLNELLTLWPWYAWVAIVAIVGAFPVLSQFVLSLTHFNLKFAEDRGFAGLANFLAYVILYWFFWGEAVNGRVERLADGSLR